MERRVDRHPTPDARPLLQRDARRERRELPLLHHALGRDRAERARVGRAAPAGRARHLPPHAGRRRRRTGAGEAAARRMRARRRRRSLRRRRRRRRRRRWRRRRRRRRVVVVLVVFALALLCLALVARRRRRRRRWRRRRWRRRRGALGRLAAAEGRSGVAAVLPLRLGREDAHALRAARLLVPPVAVLVVLARVELEAHLADLGNALPVLLGVAAVVGHALLAGVGGERRRDEEGGERKSRRRHRHCARGERRRGEEGGGERKFARATRQCDGDGRRAWVVRSRRNSYCGRNFDAD